MKRKPHTNSILLDRRFETVSLFAQLTN